jgi:hypothetical protein
MPKSKDGATSAGADSDAGKNFFFKKKFYKIY